MKLEEKLNKGWKKFLNEADDAGHYESEKSTKPIEAAFRERNVNLRNLVPFHGQHIPDTRKQAAQHVLDQVHESEHGAKQWNYNNEVYVIVDADAQMPIYLYFLEGNASIATSVEDTLGDLGYKYNANLHVPRSSAYDL